jgi:hypothetical protein
MTDKPVTLINIFKVQPGEQQRLIEQSIRLFWVPSRLATGSRWHIGVNHRNAVAQTRSLWANRLQKPSLHPCRWRPMPQRLCVLVRLPGGTPTLNDFRSS